MTESTINIAAAINEPFLVPLMVVLRSACRHLSPGWRLRVFVFGYRLSEKGRGDVDKGVADLPVEVDWREMDLSSVAAYWAGLRQEGDITCYYRLFLGAALSQEIDRVLFLDADLLVEGDLAELWVLPFDGMVVQAVPDAYAPTLHLPRLRQICIDEGSPLPPESQYINAGVQLIDLKRWREEMIGQRAATLLWKHGERIMGRDQDALNYALVGRWKRLPPVWNLHELPEHPDTWNAAGASAEEIRQAWQKPSVIHFIGWKPWGKFWRPYRSERWWAAARSAGVPEIHRARIIELWETLLFGPHTALRWHLRRSEWNRIAWLLFTRPWIPITYPFWRLFQR